MNSLPPLDLQTEHLDRSQYPSVRMLLLFAVILSAGWALSWAAAQQSVSPMRAAVVAPAPTSGHAVDREMIARAIPLRP